jgi:hypothetical protein
MARLGFSFGFGKFAAVAGILIVASLPLCAQFGPPPSTTSIGGHALAPPASVTSISGAHSPPVLPSVTSIPNSGFNNHFGYRPYFNGHNGHRNNYGAGYGYAVPYYYPTDGSYYGYDYVGGGGGAGPDVYSGPPLGPNEQVLHVIVEQPPASAYGAPPPPEPRARPQVAPDPEEHAAAPMPEVAPVEPVVLVYRSGKKQEVTNYAIMGETLYVFDDARKKIALADLDIPATIKANDDRGLEFRMPPMPAKKKAATPTPQTAKPDATDGGQPKKIAALLP